MNSDQLFDGFEPVPPKAWKQKIQVDLKGGDYNELLTTTMREGVQTKPFYTREDTVDTGGVPKREPTGWKVGYLLHPERCENPMERMQNAFAGGVENAIIQLTPKAAELSATLAGQDIPPGAIAWDWQDLRRPLSDALHPAHLGHSTVWVDPIGHFSATGNWSLGMKEDFETIFAPASEKTDQSPKLRLCLRLDTYQQAGAHRVQELAYALAHANEYLLRAEDDPARRALLERPAFRVALGGDYFADIAKLRALRKAWAILAKADGLPGTCELIAVPSLRNKTLYDYNTNMLRTSLECMAGVLGGADLICNLPYDHLFNPPNSFGDRIARNQLLLLKHESHLDKVNNPAEGAYYIEYLTDQFGKKALDLFKTLEKGGGLLAQLKTHTIQKKIREAADREAEAFQEKDVVLVGSNVFPNPSDQMSSQISTAGGQDRKGQKTLIEPLPLRRLSGAYEQNRLQNEAQ